jgi:hypothetical protein
MTSYAEIVQEQKKSRLLYPEFGAPELRARDVPRAPVGYEAAIVWTYAHRVRRWVKESKLGLSRVLRVWWSAAFEAIRREGTA